MLASLSSSIKPTQDKLNHLLGQADTTLTGVNSILDAKTTNDLKNAITELSATMRNLNQASATLNKMLVANQTNLNVTQEMCGQFPIRVFAEGSGVDFHAGQRI